MQTQTYTQTHINIYDYINRKHLARSHHFEVMRSNQKNRSIFLIDHKRSKMRHSTNKQTNKKRHKHTETTKRTDVGKWIN